MNCSERYVSGYFFVLWHLKYRYRSIKIETTVHYWSCKISNFFYFFASRRESISSIAFLKFSNFFFPLREIFLRLSTMTSNWSQPKDLEGSCHSSWQLFAANLRSRLCEVFWALFDYRQVNWGQNKSWRLSCFSDNFSDNRFNGISKKSNLLTLSFYLLMHVTVIVM